MTKNKKTSTEFQPFGTMAPRSISLSEKVRQQNVEKLNQILANTMTLRDMYKKHHWQVSGPDFYQLHLLFDKHYGEQAELVDAIAERIQTLGGVAIAMAQEVVKTATIPHPPAGREDVKTQLFRLLEAHEMIIGETRETAEAADKAGDAGTNDLLVSEVLRKNEFQVWFISEQANVDGMPTAADSEHEGELAGAGRNGR